jgi:hypothetical protein
MFPAGWYADPQDPTVQRYHDGRDWTAHQRPVADSAAPISPPPSGEPPELWLNAATSQAPQGAPGTHEALAPPGEPAAQEPPAGQPPQGWGGPLEQSWTMPAPAAAAAPSWPQQPPPGYPPTYQTGGWQPPPVAGYPSHPGPERRRRRRPLILGVVAVLIAGLLTGGYFLFLRKSDAAPLTYRGAKIKNAGDVLDQAQTNVAAIVARRHGAKSSQARCYFAVPKHQASGAKATDVDDNLRCGPVLFVDGDPAKPYLSFPLTPTQSGGTVTFTVATTPQSPDPDASPSELKLRRPDGKGAPSGAGGLAAPNPPVAANDVLLATDLGGIKAPPQVDGARMISLHTGMRLVSAGIVPRYGHGDDARSAPPGRELMAFQTSDVAGESDSRATSGSLTVRVPGAPPRTVPAAGSSTAYVVLAMPTGATAELELTDAGYIQTLSLPNGTAGPHNLVVLNRTHRTVSAARSVAVPVTISNGVNSANLTFRAKSGLAGLDFWAPGHENSRPTKTTDALLSMRLTYTDPQDPGKEFGFDPELVTLKLPDGRTVSARNIASPGKIFNVFQVPATFTTGTIVVGGSERTEGLTLKVNQPASFAISFAPN